MTRPLVRKQLIDGKLTYFVNDEPFTDKEKARKRAIKIYSKGADDETKLALARRKLIENQLKAEEKERKEKAPKNLTEKEKKIQSQLKIGGDFIDPATGFSTRDSLTAGGPFIPERFKAQKKEPTVNQQISDIDEILLQDLPEDEIKALEDARKILVRELPIYKKIIKDSPKDYMEAPEPEKKNMLIEWAKKTFGDFRKNVSDKKYVQERRKYWQKEGIESLNLSKEELKKIKGNDNGYSWAQEQALDDLKLQKENDKIINSDPLGIFTDDI
tara:strand:+ start:14951 stop:15766 length:816 start_codon:yes stop_codon:yes gene_type:complete